MSALHIIIMIILSLKKLINCRLRNHHDINYRILPIGVEMRQCLICKEMVAVYMDKYLRIKTGRAGMFFG